MQLAQYVYSYIQSHFSMYNMQLINPCACAVKIHLDIAAELAIYMLNKNTQGAKKGEANQKQQLSSR